MTEPLARLEKVLQPLSQLAVAVSGGVDSLTLAFVAARIVPGFRALHAVSPSVPPEATQRVRTYADRHQWPLIVVDTQELLNPEYRANPHNRCYFCKQNLYQTMAAHCEGPMASGTNLDDLSDFRPGLIAAKEYGVMHPFVDANISKLELREIAHSFGLDDIAELPAQPCLASRITTGLQIAPEDLRFVDHIETLLRPFAPGADLRCRIRPQGVEIQIDSLPDPARHIVERECRKNGRTFLGVRPYRRGSAFIVPAQPQHT